MLVVMLLRIKDSDYDKQSAEHPDEEENFLVMGMQHPSYRTYDDDDVEEYTAPSSRSSKKKSSGIWSSFIVPKN